MKHLSLHNCDRSFFSTQMSVIYNVFKVKVFCKSDDTLSRMKTALKGDSHIETDNKHITNITVVHGNVVEIQVCVRRIALGTGAVVYMTILIAKQIIIFIKIRISLLIDLLLLFFLGCVIYLY